jgi:leucyl aminopeptidase
MKINFLPINKFQDAKNKLYIISKESIQSFEDEERAAMIDQSFDGKSGEKFLNPKKGKIEICISIGGEDDASNQEMRSLGAKIFSYANAEKIKQLNISFIKIEQKLSAENITNFVFGLKLKSYRFNKYFSKKKEDKLLKVEEVNIFATENSKIEKNFSEKEIIAENIFLARDLTSEPSNELNPESYANFIKKDLGNNGVEVEILDEAKMTELGMKALLGVGQGSKYGSKLVIMKWLGAEDKTAQPVAFVGKGVTFDTGGISIKPSNNMEDMKTDMSGSAVVVSLLNLLAQRKAKVNAIGVVGLAENMPSGDAQKPGDVVTSMSGQTIEIINTDAEGRLVLADALHYTNITYKPKFIVDLATLTGAVIVSLADIHAGLFANDDDLAHEISEAGQETGELVWRLPIGKKYDEMINSDVADMKNVGAGRGAGSTTAAQFLKRFVGDTKWAHLDIAGVAWKGKGDALAIKGATGFGVYLLNIFIANNYER